MDTVPELNRRGVEAIFGQAGFPAPLKSHHTAIVGSAYTQGGPAHIKRDTSPGWDRKTLSHRVTNTCLRFQERKGKHHARTSLSNPLSSACSKRGRNRVCSSSDGRFPNAPPQELPDNVLWTGLHRELKQVGRKKNFFWVIQSRHFTGGKANQKFAVILEILLASKSNIFAPCITFR